MSEHIKIGDITPRIRYEANGVQTSFIYHFPIFKEEDLQVWVDSDLVATGYEISGIGESEGGQIVFDTAPADGTIITLVRKLIIERVSDFQTGGSFRAKVINDELDFQTASLQQVNCEVLRAMRLSPYAPDANMELPIPNAGKALLWNEEGNGIINSISNFNNIVVDATAQADIAIAQAGIATTKAGEANDSAASAAASAALIDFADFSALDAATTPADDDYLVMQRVSGVKRSLTFLKLWDNYVKSKISSLWQTSLAPAGTVINTAYAQVTSNVTTTDNSGADVVSLAYTPKRNNSLLRITVTGYRLLANYDYGSSEVNASISGYVHLFEGATQIGGMSTQLVGRSADNGNATIQVPIYINRVKASGSTNERTYTAKVYASPSGITSTATADASNPIQLIIQEIAQ